MVSYKFTALATQVSNRRLNHLQRYQRVGKRSQQSKNRSRVTPRSPQLGMFEDRLELEIFHQYDPSTREVEWAYYSPDGGFLLQFGFSLTERCYRIYSLHTSLFQDQTDMQRYLAAINQNLRGHYPALELAMSPQGPEIRVI